MDFLIGNTSVAGWGLLAVGVYTLLLGNTGSMQQPRREQCWARKHFLLGYLCFLVGFSLVTENTTAGVPSLFSSLSEHSPDSQRAATATIALIAGSLGVMRDREQPSFGLGWVIVVVNSNLFPVLAMHGLGPDIATRVVACKCWFSVTHVLTAWCGRRSVA